jgi:hypothetical protein
VYAVRLQLPQATIHHAGMAGSQFETAHVLSLLNSRLSALLQHMLQALPPRHWQWQRNCLERFLTKFGTVVASDTPLSRPCPAGLSSPAPS